MNALLLLLLASLACRAEIIDRIAVTVGNGVITESEILREIRLTAFLNGEPLDFSPAVKRKTAERLVEQRLISNEIGASLYPLPGAAAAQEMLKQIKDRFPNPAVYQEEMLRVGITEDELKAHLARQLATLSFLDFRFRPGIQIDDDEIRRRRGVRTHRFVVAESEPFDQRTDDASDQHARRPSVAERHLQSRRTMGDRLRDSHRAPQPLMLGLQPLEPCLNVIDSRRFEESSHAIQDEACVVGKCSKPRRNLTR